MGIEFLITSFVVVISPGPGALLTVAAGLSGGARAAAVTALGCTIGQGLSGVSNLSLTSFTAVAGIVAGAVVALKYQAWRLEKSL